jgi:flagellar motor switch/type III secretory pathway protein FliN
MIPTLSLDDACANRTSPHAFATKARYESESVAGRNAFYGSSLNPNAVLAVQWSPQHQFEQVAAQATLHCLQGEVSLWISRSASFPHASFSLVSVLPNLPQTLRCAALEELLGDLLREWATAHGLTLLSMQVDAVQTKLTTAQQLATAFCRIWSPAQEISLFVAASSQAGGVIARLRRHGPVSDGLLGCRTRLSLRTAPMHLMVSAARCLAVGDGLDIGSLEENGLRLLLCAGPAQQVWAHMTWKGNRMTLDHLLDPGDMHAHDGVPTLTNEPVQLAPAPAARVEHLSLRLSVEVASLTVPVGELSKWREGHVMNLNLPLNATAVSLLIDERVVGRGHMVALDDRLAVEVTEWTLTPTGTHAI